jgi:Fur family ferric uptake transcriptional regulator
MKEPIKDPSLNRGRIQEMVRDYLRSQGLPLTATRLGIIDAIFSSHDHFTIRQLHDRLVEGGREVSMMSLYRTLPILVKSGYLRELEVGGEEKLYDPNHGTSPDHHHIRCKDCGKLVEFLDPCLDLRERAMAESMGFRTDSVIFRLEARCEEHRLHGQCTRRGSEGEKEQLPSGKPGKRLSPGDSKS